MIENHHDSDFSDRVTGKNMEKNLSTSDAFPNWTPPINLTRFQNFRDIKLSTRDPKQQRRAISSSVDTSLETTTVLNMEKNFSSEFISFVNGNADDSLLNSTSPCCVTPFNLTRFQNFKDTILSTGGPKQRQKVSNITKVQDTRETFSIVVLGGSISCAMPHHSEHVDACHGNLYLAWPSQLKALLDRNNYTNVIVHNLCKVAQGTNSWVDDMLKWESERDAGNYGNPIFAADIVMIEAVVNDIDNKVDAKSRFGGIVDGITQETEMLARLLLQLPKSPALIWVEASRSQRYVHNAVPSHSAVLIPYGIPHLDMMEAFDPNDDSWFKSAYVVDMYGHISSLGHRMVAFYVYNFLHVLGGPEEYNCGGNDFQHTQCCISDSKITSSPSYRCININDPTLPPPLYLNETYSDMYEFGNPRFVDFETRESVGLGRYEYKHILDYAGFSHFADRPGKTGYIGLNIGNTVSFRYIPEEISESFIHKQLQLRYVKSYENFGSANISIYLSDYTGPAMLNLYGSPYCPMHQTLVASEVIDCQWSPDSNGTIPQVSLAVETMMDLRGIFVNTTSYPCLDIRVTIVPSVEERKQNKVKILSICIL